MDVKYIRLFNILLSAYKFVKRSWQIVLKVVE